MLSQKTPLFILGLCVFSAFGLVFLFTAGILDKPAKIPEEECLHFAKKIENSIVENDPAFLNNALNHYSFLKKVAGNSGFYNKTQLANLSVQVKDNIRFGDMVMRYLKSNDGYFNFTKLYYQNRDPHIIFRIYSQLEGLNYFDCELEQINGKIKITDVFIYYAGELWSTSYSRHMNLLAEYNKGGLDNIHRENEFNNSLIKVDYIRELLFLGKVKQAEEFYFSIPEPFRKDKIIQGTALKIAAQKSDSAYIAAIDSYLAADPKNETFNRFFNVLRHLAAKENSKARQAITDLNEVTGQDSLMQLFIGQTFQNENLFQKAIPYFDNVINRYPDLFEAYWYKITSLIRTNQFQKVVQLLNTIIINFEARKVDLDNLLVEFPNFLNSKEYLEWRNLVNI